MQAGGELRHHLHRIERLDSAGLLLDQVNDDLPFVSVFAGAEMADTQDAIVI
jgi:hypothetical protein